MMGLGRVFQEMMQETMGRISYTQQVLDTAPLDCRVRPNRRPPPPPPIRVPPRPPSKKTQQRSYCPYCGRRVSVDVEECPGCGAPQ